uniref:NADH-ubiquinone oxidoreductase chain 1 n=1 Tax=Leptomyrmex pallens TaxID=611136 RepID=V5JEZ5_9HYME|nr:NADH dehydrogenase subunit 1 [Leptomyrmex pallens]AGL61403.1 NADH dehydrogenase subunit 1 [Leptomyrmex pallens]
MSMILNVVSVLLLVIILMMGVAFLTLLERKMLGYVQSRKGPNKVGHSGAFQPFSDAVKLFSKEVFYVFQVNVYIYSLCPVFGILMMLMIWMVYPIVTNIYFMNYSMLFMLVILSVGGYVILMMGWSSNSAYSLLGALRVVAQSVSYEVSFMFIILVIMMLGETYSLGDLWAWQIYIWNLVFIFPVFVLFFISVLVELNRSPVDLAEGESELVSGFNVEYFSGGFALIFMAEYGMIIFFLLFLSILFIGIKGHILIFFWVSIFSSAIIFMRGILPRMRYDLLMSLCWKIILPVSLNYLVLVFVFKVFCMGIF